MAQPLEADLPLSASPRSPVQPFRPDTLTPASIGAVAACFIANVISSAPIVSGTFGIFMLPITGEIGWSRTAYTSVLTMTALIGVFAFPWGGRLADRIGPRPMMLWGLVAYGLALALLSLVNASPLIFFGLYALIALASAGPSTVVGAKLISGWFVQRRGTILGLTGGGGISLGYILAPHVSHALIDAFGWRGAYIGMGAIVLGLGLPTAWLFLRDPPASARTDAETPADLTGMTAAEARATPQFWMLMAAVVLGAGATTVFYTHLVPYASDRKMPTEAALWALSAAGASNGLWQIIMGRVLDRTATPRIAAPMVLAGLAGLALVLLTSTPAAWVLGGLLLGVSSGSEYGLVPYALQRYFGRRAFGGLYGLIYGVVWLSMGVFPLASAAVFDLLGSYDLALAASGLFILASAVLLFVLPRYALSADQS